MKNTQQIERKLAQHQTPLYLKPFELEVAWVASLAGWSSKASIRKGPVFKPRIQV